MSIDWQARLRALVFQQFAVSNWAIPIANELGAQRQGLQGILDAVSLLWSIDPVVPDSATTDPAYGVGRGVHLDRIGKLVGQPRGAAPDAEYRPLLRARVLANKSRGTASDVIGVFVAMFAGEGHPLIIPGWIAQYTIRLVGVVMDPLIVPAAVGLLNAATQAGTRAVLEWTTVPPSQQLTWNDLTPTAPNTPCPTGWGDVTSPTTGGRWGGAAST